MKKQASVDGIFIKKKFGQHFLKDKNILNKIVDSASLNSSSNVIEIGGGSGVLTKTILERDINKLWVFEIDEDWANYLEREIEDKRLKVWHTNFLEVDFSIFKDTESWTLISNLPYNVTFPILSKLVEHRSILKEGVIMIQEEVAEKILKTSGRGYGFVSLYFQYFFEWKKIIKVGPGHFYPPPKVDSRVLYFKPKKDLIKIERIDEFWNFVKVCFKQPRRTLLNNLKQAHFNYEKIDQKILGLRAQQLSFNDFLSIWQKILG